MGVAAVRVHSVLHPRAVPLCGVKLMVMRLKHVGSAHVGAVLRVKLRSGRAPGSWQKWTFFRSPRPQGGRRRNRKFTTMRVVTYMK